jgi:hypothetical protein
MYVYIYISEYYNRQSTQRHVSKYQNRARIHCTHTIAPDTINLHVHILFFYTRRGGARDARQLCAWAEVRRHVY